MGFQLPCLKRFGIIRYPSIPLDFSQDINIRRKFWILFVVLIGSFSYTYFELVMLNFLEAFP